MLKQRVEQIVRVCELTLRCEEGGIAGQRLIEQIDSGFQVFRADRTETSVQDEVLRPAVELECGDVTCGRSSIAFFSLGDSFSACN